MEYGYIKSLVLDRGFGFIGRDSNSQDCFFHMRALGGGLEWSEQLKGQRVEFRTELDPIHGRLRASVVLPASN